MAPLSLARMDHQRRSQADRRHVHAVGDGHAAPRGHRCGDDAVTTDFRLPRAWLSAAGTLRSGVLRAWRDHDFLCRDAVRDRAGEFRRAVAARRTRRRLSYPQFRRLLVDRDWRLAGQPLAYRRRIRADGLAAVSAAL